MKKILIALDSSSLDENLLTFGVYLGRLTRSKITGVFLENQRAYGRPVIRNRYEGTYLGWEVDEQSKEWQEKMRLLEQQIQQFKAFYNNHGIEAVIRRDAGLPVREMIGETRYADLLVLDAETSFRQHWEKLPTGFVEEILSKSECPVVIAPGHFEGVEEIVFAWEDGPAAAFAMKSFTYLFPQLSDKKVIVVTAGPDMPAAEAKNNLQEWLNDHYATVEWEDLEGDADTALFGYLLKKKKAFLVFGAYGRSTLSRFFRHSHAEKVIKTVAQPIFIAHG